MRLPGEWGGLLLGLLVVDTINVFWSLLCSSVRLSVCVTVTMWQHHNDTERYKETESQTDRQTDRQTEGADHETCSHTTLIGADKSLGYFRLPIVIGKHTQLTVAITGGTTVLRMDLQSNVLTFTHASDVLGSQSYTRYLLHEQINLETHLLCMH